jgi:hypothetical protein
VEFDEFVDPFIGSSDIPKVAIPGVAAEEVVNLEVNEETPKTNAASSGQVPDDASPLDVAKKAGDSGDHKRKRKKISSGLSSPGAQERMKKQFLDQFYESRLGAPSCSFISSCLLNI